MNEKICGEGKEELIHHAGHHHVRSRGSKQHSKYELQNHTEESAQQIQQMKVTPGLTVLTATLNACRSDAH